MRKLDSSLRLIFLRNEFRHSEGMARSKACNFLNAIKRDHTKDVYIYDAHVKLPRKRPDGVNPFVAILYMSQKHNRYFIVHHVYMSLSFD